jgi:hypothetical protein
MRNRKSMAFGALVAIILVLAAALVLAGFVVKVAHTMERGGDTEKCRLSVIAATKLKAAGKTISSINCPRTQLTIRAGDVQVSGTADQEKAKKLISDEVNRCWYKMSGDNRLNPYDQDWFVSTKTVCVICSEIGFEQEVNDQLPTIQGIKSYLTSQGNLGEQQAVKEFNYLVVVLQTQMDKLNSVDFLDTGKKYYVVYVTYSKQWFFDDTSVHNQIIKKLSNGIFLGVDSYSIINLIPAEQIGSLGCGSLKG